MVGGCSYTRVRLDYGEDVGHLDESPFGYTGAAQFGEVEDYPYPSAYISSS